MGFTDIFGGTVIYPSQTTFLALTMTANVSLSWPIEQQMGGPVVADIIEVNASLPGLQIVIPDATQITTGFATLFNNVGGNTFDVVDSTGALIISIVSGSAWEIYLRDNSTPAGLWRSFQYGASVSVANAAALAGAGLKAISTTLNARIVIDSHSTNYVILDTDRAKCEQWTGGVGQFTLPNSGTVGSDWFCSMRNSGSGNLTVAPPSGTINSSPSITFAPGDSGWIVCDGTNYFTLGFGSASGGGSGFDFIQINVSGAGNYTLSGVELNRIGYRFTGVLSGNRNIIVPNTTQEYWVDNETTGAFSLFVNTAAQTPGVEILQTQTNILYCDGTNVIPAVSASISFPISVAQGGTGAINAATARTNLGAAANTITLTAGSGLTGGGDLSANRTFDVGAGTGIVVNANDVTVDRNNATLTSTVGYNGVPPVTMNANYTFAASDNGLMYQHTTGAHIWTLPLNATVPIPNGFAVTGDCGNGSTNVALTPAGGVTLRLAGTTTTGTRNIAANGQFTFVKIGTDEWKVNGAGIS